MRSFGASLRLFQRRKHSTSRSWAKPIFRAIAPRLADDLVQHAGDVGGVLEAKVFAERQRGALGDGGGQSRMPDEELLQLDVAIIQQERHRSHGEIEGLERGPEIDEPVAPGDFEQAVAEVRLDQPPSSGEAGFFEAREIRSKSRSAA